MRLLHLVLIIGAVSSSRSETPSSVQRSLGSTMEEDLSIFVRLTGRGLTAPLHWERDDWRNAGGTVLITAVSSLLDDEAYAVVLRNRTATHDKFERVFEAYSNGLSGIIFSSVLYSSGLLFDSEWLRGSGLIMASALTISAITQTTLKYIAGRSRPYTGTSYRTFRPFSFNSDYVSFPSGHTIVAFTISTVLARRIDNVYASIALYTLATLGGLSRIYSGNHWLSDVVFGGALALSVSSSVIKWYEGETTGDDRGFHIIPQANRLTLVWSF
jgi:membrane-associated phospholipid phosphatase